MQIYRILAKRTALVFVSMLAMSLATGCCTKTVKKNGGNSADRLINSRSDPRPSQAQRRPSGLSREDELNTSDPQLNESRRRKTEQYRRLEYAHEMLLDNNPQGSLRELERLQLDIREDPYLEMQAWYLSAMVYHKLGKPSRRKRSMRKMLETMEQLQKDPRFRTAYEDGRLSQQAIDKAKKEAGVKYDKFD
jgi:hypothetical protein